MSPQRRPLGFWWRMTRPFVWRWRLGYWDWDAIRAVWWEL